MPVLSIALNRKTLFSANVRKRGSGWKAVGETSTASDENKRVAMYRVLIDHLLQDEKFRQVLRERRGQ